MKGMKFGIGVFVILLVLGFALGNTVNANSAEPGASSDPLVTKSYVDKVVNEKANELQSQINDLKQQLEQLK